MVKRTVLSAFGLKSLTAKAKTYLDECRQYDWELDDDHHGIRG